MPWTIDSRFDAAVLDRENRPVALVEVKAQPVERWATILQGRLTDLAERVDFILAADPNSIQLYKPEGESLGEPIAQLDTWQVLRHYAPKYPKKRVFEPYLLALVEAWLRDLAYHWKSANPPGSEALVKTGLLETIEGGTTQPLGD